MADNIATTTVNPVSGNKLLSFIKRHFTARFLLVNLFFVALAAIFMGPILLNLTTSAHGAISTSNGLLWLQSLQGAPFGSLTTSVNFPFGEDLFKPEFITSALVIAPFWVFTKLFGAVAAWNIIIFTSVWASGISMYYFVRKLTQNPMAALWAGAAFAYLPFHQYKTSGYIIYAFSFVLVWLAWALLNFIKDQTKKNAILLALICAATFYIDRYYVLFALLMVGVPMILFGLRSVVTITARKIDALKNLIRKSLLFLASLTALLLPLIGAKLFYNVNLYADSAAPGVVVASNWLDYILPAASHPVFGQLVSGLRGGSVSYVMYLGIVLVVAALWALFYLWNQAESKQEMQQKFAAKWLLAAGLGAFLLTMPQVIYLLSYSIPLPSVWISWVAHYWPLYMHAMLIVGLVLVVIAAMGIASGLARVKKQTIAWLLTAVLISVTLFEYAAFNPFNRQDIWAHSQLSNAQQWLHNQNNITVIASYPLQNESPNLYLAEQQVNKKKLVNMSGLGEKNKLHGSIAGLRDAQALSVLKALGVHAIVTHDVAEDRAIKDLKLARSGDKGTDIFRISDSITPAKYALVADGGVRSFVKDQKSIHAVGANGVATLNVVALPGTLTEPTRVNAAFELRMADNFKAGDVIISQGGYILDLLHVSPKERLKLEYASLISNLPIVVHVVGVNGQADQAFLQDLRITE